MSIRGIFLLEYMANSCIDSFREKKAETEKKRQIEGFCEGREQGEKDCCSRVSYICFPGKTAVLILNFLSFFCERKAGESRVRDTEFRIFAFPTYLRLKKGACET